VGTNIVNAHPVLAPVEPPGAERSERLTPLLVLVRKSRRATAGRIALALLLALSRTQSTEAQSFLPLPGVDPNAPVISTAEGISGDGQIVVGASGFDAVRWLPGGTLDVLGVVPGDFDAVAMAAILDGSLVAGTSYTGNVGSAFVWTFANGFQELGGVNSRAGAISNDGVVVVGTANDPTSGLARAFRRTAANGIQYLGSASIGAPSYGLGVSPEGNVTVGQTNTKQGARGFFHTASAGFVTLSPLTGDTASQAVDASLNGQIIVGASSGQVFAATQGATSQLFRRVNGTLIGLGDIKGGGFRSYANAVSNNGTVIVGVGNSDASIDRAVYWTTTNGLLDLQNLLVREHAIDLTGWTLTEATGVSDNGLTIVGNGINPMGQSQAWVATLPGTPLQSAPQVTVKCSTTTATLGSQVTVTLTAKRQQFGTLVPLANVRATITAWSVLGSQVIGNAVTNSSGQIQVKYKPSNALGAGSQLLFGGVVLTDGTSGEGVATLKVKSR
jgi:uncharacterized membrane protein